MCVGYFSFYLMTGTFAKSSYKFCKIITSVIYIYDDFFMSVGLFFVIKERLGGNAGPGVFYPILCG